MSIFLPSELRGIIADILKGTEGTVRYPTEEVKNAHDPLCIEDSRLIRKKMVK
jgi:hypothetical protein